MRALASLALSALLLGGCTSLRGGAARDPSSHYRIDGLPLARYLAEKPGLAERRVGDWVLYHDARLPSATVDELVARASRARAAVEQTLAQEFARPVALYFPPAGAVHDLREGARRTNGFSAMFGADLFALIRAPWPESTLRHELVHCLFNASGRETSWLEEGIAEFLTSEDGDGSRPGLADVLARYGPVEWDELADFDEGRDPDLRKRATAWLAAYQLVHEQGLSLAEIAALDSPEDALSPAWASASFDRASLGTGERAQVELRQGLEKR